MATDKILSLKCAWTVCQRCAQQCHVSYLGFHTLITPQNPFRCPIMQNNLLVMFRIQKVNCSITTFTHLKPSSGNNDTVAMTARAPIAASDCLIPLYVLFLLTASFQIFFILTWRWEINFIISVVQSVHLCVFTHVSELTIKVFESL